MLGYVFRAAYRVLRQTGAFELFVIEGWLLERPDELFRGMLLELFRAALRESVDRPVRAVQKEGLAPEARRRRARGRDHGPHRPQRRLARDGRYERAAGDGGKGAVTRDGEMVTPPVPEPTPAVLILDSRGADSQYLAVLMRANTH